MPNIAHYPGDCTNFDPDHYVGADTAGAFYRPVAATYDAEADVTTIQYKPMALREMSTRYGHLIDQAEQRAYLADLFGGAL